MLEHARTYGELSPGGSAFVAGSFGQLEMVQGDGSAARTLGAQRGTPLRVHRLRRDAPITGLCALRARSRARPGLRQAPRPPANPPPSAGVGARSVPAASALEVARGAPRRQPLCRSRARLPRGARPEQNARARRSGSPRPCSRPVAMPKRSSSPAERHPRTRRRSRARAFARRARAPPTGALSRSRNELRARRSRSSPRTQARLLLGEILIELGRRKDARAPLLALIEDYNEDRIDARDGRALALVGRAAHLLRSPRDANEAFSEAEASGVFDRQLLLWRAELFLEKYDPGNAEELLSEVLERAPNDADALVSLAHVRLDQALDFDEAERLVRRALAINPKLAEAYFVLGGVALRDQELELVEKHVAEGLAIRPGDLAPLELARGCTFRRRRPRRASRPHGATCSRETPSTRRSTPSSESMPTGSTATTRSSSSCARR